jgi:plasmid stabilization system protein ParE
MVKWTNHASTQLRHIHDYIEQDSPLYAKRVSDAMVHKIAKLDQLPYMGRKVAELNEELIREIALYSIESFMKSRLTTI